MGIYYPPGETRPLVVQRGHEEDVLFLIEEDPKRFASSPREYLREVDLFAASALLNALTQTFWENYPLILPLLEGCVKRLKCYPACEQIRGWIPYVKRSVAWRSLNWN